MFLNKNKAVFLASLLQSSVAHDPSEIIIICWFADLLKKHVLLLLLMYKTVVLLLWSFIKIFMVSFGQFNVSFLKKNINFVQKTLLPNFWTVMNVLMVSSY